MTQFDIIVIGAGSAGVRLARLLAAHGKSVAIIEKSALGGTCVNLGCVPKKLFMYASHFSEDFEDALGFGWNIGKNNIQFNWQKLVTNKNREIARLNIIYQNLLENAGVKIYHGHAKFQSPSEIVINNQTFIRGHKIIIACGGKPFIPEISGKEFVITSDEVFHLEKLPASILIVGGGYIAVEFASIFHGLGVNVQQVYRKKLFLRGFDEECRQILAEQMRAKGINIAFDTDIKSITKSSGVYEVLTDTGLKFVADAVMYATGREPVAGGLGLENTYVATNENGFISVDHNFRTSDECIYAIGDVIGEMTLTPVATAQAMKLADHLLHKNEISFSYHNIPSAIFSQPNMATVGLNEEEARLVLGDNVTVYKTRFTHMKHSLSKRQEQVFMKLVVNKISGVVLGAHMIGPDAGEIIQGVAVAITCGATKADFDNTIGIHPTMAEEFVTMRTPAS